MEPAKTSTNNSSNNPVPEKSSNTRKNCNQPETGTDVLSTTCDHCKSKIYLAKNNDKSANFTQTSGKKDNAIQFNSRHMNGMTLKICSNVTLEPNDDEERLKQQQHYRQSSSVNPNLEYHQFYFSAPQSTLSDEASSFGLSSINDYQNNNLAENEYYRNCPQNRQNFSFNYPSQSDNCLFPINLGTAAQLRQMQVPSRFFYTNAGGMQRMAPQPEPVVYVRAPPQIESYYRNYPSVERPMFAFVPSSLNPNYMPYPYSASPDQFNWNPNVGPGQFCTPPQPPQPPPPPPSKPPHQASKFNVSNRNVSFTGSNIHQFPSAKYLGQMPARPQPQPPVRVNSSVANHQKVPLPPPPQATPAQVASVDSILPLLSKLTKITANHFISSPNSSNRNSILSPNQDLQQLENSILSSLTSFNNHNHNKK